MVPRTLLFDFNGVIVNDEPAHCQALLAILEELGIRIDPGQYYRDYLGLDDRACFRKALRAVGHPDPSEPMLADLVRRKSARYARDTGDSPTFVPGALEFIREAARQECPLAIVSAALSQEIHQVLVMSGLDSIFGCVIAAEDVTACKPDPAGYLEALQRLASRPEDAMILEDSLPGLAAARAARVRCTMLTTSHGANLLAGADAVWENLLGRTVADLPWANG